MIRLAVLACSLFAFAACTSETQKTADPDAKTPPPVAPVALAEEVTARLAQFDAKDGTVDKVVHRCAGCSLGMDGEDKWPLTVGDYTMHFCKQGCLDKFAKDPAPAILAVKAK